MKINVALLFFLFLLGCQTNSKIADQSESPKNLQNKQMEGNTASDSQTTDESKQRPVAKSDSGKMMQKSGLQKSENEVSKMEVTTSDSKMTQKTQQGNFEPQQKTMEKQTPTDVDSSNKNLMEKPNVEFVSIDEEPIGNHPLVGQSLPFSRVLTSQGKIIDFKEYQQRKQLLLVILRGFNGFVCPFCTNQTLQLSNAADKFDQLDTEIILIYPGKEEHIDKFIESVQDLDSSLGKDFEIPFEIGLDIELQLVKQLDIGGKLARPTSIILDKQGLIKYVYIGESESDRPSVETLLSEVSK